MENLTNNNQKPKNTIEEEAATLDAKQEIIEAEVKPATKESLLATVLDVKQEIIEAEAKPAPKKRGRPRKHIEQDVCEPQNTLQLNEDNKIECNAGCKAGYKTSECEASCKAGECKVDNREAQNSKVENSKVENSKAQNSKEKNSKVENSKEKNSKAENSKVENSKVERDTLAKKRKTQNTANKAVQKKKKQTTDNNRDIVVRAKRVIKKGDLEGIIMFFNTKQKEINENSEIVLGLLEDYYNMQMEINHTVNKILTYAKEARIRKLPTSGLFRIKLSDVL